MNLLSQYRGLRRENYVLCFGRLVTAMGSLIWPMLTMILSQKMGMGAEHIAWIIAAAGILSLPANLIGGRMADSFNKKMNIIYLDIVSVTCYLICAVIPLSGISIVLMFIASTSQNMEHPSYNALAADLTTTEDRERGYSLQYLGANLGFVISPMLAGYLFKDYLWLAFLISASAIASSAVLIFFQVKDITPVQDVGHNAQYQAERKGVGLAAVLRENRIIILYVLAISGYHATYQMYSYLMPLDLAKIHGDSGAVIFGSITSVNCVVVVLFTPLLTKMFQGLSDPVKTILGQTLLLAGFAVFLLFQGQIPFYYAAMTILTWGEIFSVLAENPYLTKRMPASHRGRINGLAAVVRIGIASVYQLVIGKVYETASSVAAWSTVLAIGGGFVLICIMLAVKDRKVYKNLY
ncbi:MAG: MFS transporter [Coprococcus sp.]|nr:MFS transporter [Coprococcus sp.]